MLVILHDKLAQDFIVPWELDSLGMKLFLLHISLERDSTTASSQSVSEQSECPVGSLLLRVKTRLLTE